MPKRLLKKEPMPTSQPDSGEAVKRYQISGRVPLYQRAGLSIVFSNQPMVLASDFDAQALMLGNLERAHLQLLTDLKAAESELSRIKQALEWAESNQIGLIYLSPFWKAMKSIHESHEPTILAAIEALQAKCEEGK